MVGPVAAAIVAASPRPYPTAAASPSLSPAAAAVLQDPGAAAVAAPSRLVDPAAAFCWSAPAAAAAFSDPTAAIFPPLLGPAVGGGSPSPLPLLLTDGGPESST